jgi:hypothetical protein
MYVKNPTCKSVLHVENERIVAVATIGPDAGLKHLVAEAHENIHSIHFMNVPIVHMAQMIIDAIAEKTDCVMEPGFGAFLAANNIDSAVKKAVYLDMACSVRLFLNQAEKK